MQHPIPLRYQWTPVLLLVLLIPFRDGMALPPAGASLFRHLAYPIAHAGFLHWFINATAWLSLWRFVSWRRMAAAWCSAVLIGYLAPYLQLPFLPCSERRPVLGFSVVIFWFLGFILPLLRSGARLRLVATVCISCFIPGIAASFHIAALFLGLAYGFVRLAYIRTKPSYMV